MAGAHQRRAQVLEWIFRVGLLLKGIDGVLEIIGGVLFLLFKPDQLDSVARILTQLMCPVQTPTKIDTC